MKSVYSVVLAAAVGFALGAAYSVQASPGINDIIRGEAERQVQDAISNALKVDLSDGQGRVEIGEHGISIYDSRDRLVSRYDANGSYHAKPEQFSEIRVPQAGGGYMVINDKGVWHENGSGPTHGLTGQGLCTHGAAGAGGEAGAGSGSGGGSAESPQVCIQARFLDLQDNFLEDIGVEFRGLETQGETEFVEQGATLEVTPQVNADGNISLELNPTVRDPEFGDLPSVTTQRIRTEVLVDTGDTIVLGGLIKKVQVDDADKVPFLGDIPLLGYLFRSTQDRQRSDLSIFITPVIVASE